VQRTRKLLPSSGYWAAAGLGAAQPWAATSSLRSSLWLALPDFVGTSRVCGLDHRSGHRPRWLRHWRGPFVWRLLPDNLGRPESYGPKARLASWALRVLVRLIMTRHLTQTPYQGETLVGIFLGHGINIQLKPVLRFLSDEFLHMCMNVVPANDCRADQARPAPS
jgi:hypothetical protein